MKKSFFNQKGKNWRYIYFIVIGFFLGNFMGLFVNNVIAIDIVHSFNIEDGSLGDVYNSSHIVNPDFFINSKIQTVAGVKWGYHTVEGSTVRSGSKALTFSYKTAYGMFVWQNYTYSQNFITSINFYVRGNVNANSVKFGFYNKTYQSKASPFLIMGITNLGGIGATTGGFYADEGLATNVYIQPSTQKSKTKWYNIGFTIIDNEYADYTFNGTTVRGFLADTQINYSTMRIDSLFINGLGSASEYFYIDDINITVSDSITGGGISPICGYDMSMYKFRGDLNYQNSYTFNSMSIYENFKVPITTTLKGISLAVDPTQYYDDSTLTNYSLSLNGNGLGHPDCFYENGDSYILFWVCDIFVENTTLSFNFIHTKQSYGNRYWIACRGDYGYDIDLDGDSLSGSKNYLGQDCRWRYIPTFPYYWWVCTDLYQEEHNFDLQYNFYYTSIETPNQYNYTDSLGLHGYTTKNSTGYLYNINNPNGIIGSYTIGDRAYQYTIEVFKNGTLLNTSGFPYLCSYPSGSFGLIPDTIGKYKFSLKKVGYVDNITAYVTGSLDNFYISTNPPITDQFESYDVLYRYYHQQGLNGSMAMFHILERINTFSYNLFSSELIKDTTGSINYDSSYNAVEYWRLFVNRNGIYSPIGNLAKHYIRIPSIVDNTISFLPLVLQISGNNQEGKQIVIKGHHTFPGCDVKVYANDIYVSSVGENQNFETYFTPAEVGLYTITLRINQDGNIITISTAPNQLTVTTIDIGEEEKPLLEAPYSYIAGTILTIVCLILPVIALGKLNIQSDILKYVPIFSGTLGFILSCLIGFFPWYAIFGLILVLVVIIVIVHKSKD